MSLNISRLATIFLVLAFLAGGVSLLLSQNGSQPIGAQTSETPKPMNLAGGSAFVEKIPEPVRESSPENAASAKKTLTDIFAEAIGKNLLAANPQGPAEFSDGLAALPPDTTSTLASFFDDPEVYQPILSDAVAVLSRRSDPKKVRVTRNASKEAQADYISSLTFILENQFLDEKFTRIIQDDPTPDAVNASEIRLDQILKKLDELQVPEKYLDLHLAGRDMVLRLRDFAATQADGSEDPVRNMLALEREAGAVNTAIANFQKEFSKADWTAAISRSGGGGWPGLLGIRTAQAQIPVTDAVNVGLNAAQVAKTIVNWIKMYLTELLKDKLVHRIMQQTTAWIQGGGKPQFVTNWKGFLSKAATDAVDKTISRINPRVCAPFRPLISLAFQTTNLAPEEGVSCTLDQVVRNVRGFYDDFSTGGWLAYGSVLKPQNNVYGILIETSDIVSTEASRNAQAKLQESVAGKGFKPSVQCVKQHAYKTLQDCIDQEGDDYFCKNVSGGKCPSSYCFEERTTTPPATIGESVSQAMGAPLQRIVNAQDVAGLINALMNSLLNKLVNAVKGKNGDPGLLGAELGEAQSSFQEVCGNISNQKAYLECRMETRKACRNLPPDMQDGCDGAITDGPPAPAESADATSTEGTPLETP